MNYYVIGKTICKDHTTGLAVFQGEFLRDAFHLARRRIASALGGYCSRGSPIIPLQ
jgi:hypothetical protein